MECHKGFVAAAQLLSSTSLGRAMKFHVCFLESNLMQLSYCPFAKIPHDFFRA